MRWRDAATLARRNVARKPGRAVLTVLAVALAAALFTALLTITRTAETRVLNQLSAGGPLAGIKVAAAAPDPAQLGVDNATPGEPKVLDDNAIASIRAVTGVKSVVRFISNNSVVIPPKTLPNGQAVVTTVQEQSFLQGALFQRVVGVDLDQADQLPITVLAGRLPQPNSATEAVVTPTFLKSIGVARTAAADVVSMHVQVGAPRGQGRQRAALLARWTNYTVVGVAAEDAAPAEIMTSIQSTQADRAWTIAGGNVQGIDIPKSPYDGLFVVSKELDDVDTVRNAITNIGYSTSAPENLIASVQRYLRVVEIVLGGIGVIALIISALGITNAMLAAVRERRREIGVLKAIGARDRDIASVFLTEASVLGLIGGVLGAALGLGFASGVGVIVTGYLKAQGLEGVHAALPIWSLVAAVVGAMLISLVAGIVPAFRAARLPAREAVDA